MTSSRCATSRRALLAGDTAAAATHVDACPACARFAAGLQRLDTTLEGETAAASRAVLPPTLRQRILASTSRAARPASSGGAPVLELALRLAAVAAVLLAAFIALPAELRAGELDLSGLDAFESRVKAAVTDAPEMVWPVLDDGLPRPPVESPWLLGASAVLLLAAGGVALRVGEKTR